MAPIIDTDDPRAIDVLNREGIKYKLGNQSPIAQATPVKSKDAWTIDGVKYKEQVISVELSRELLPAMNLEQMKAHAKEAMEQGRPYSANAPFVFAIARRAKEQDNHEVQGFMRNAFFGQFPNTLSVVRYAPRGRLDTIVHNPGLSDEHSAEIDFVAPDELVKCSKRKEDYKALLGTDNSDEVDDVFGWVTEKRIYLWRVNQRLVSGVDERVVGLFANSGWFFLSCDRGPLGAYASFGVRIGQKNFVGKE